MTRRFAFEVRAEYGLFLLVDPSAPQPWPFVDGVGGPDDVVVETITGIGFKSAARDFYPSVTVDVFDDEPLDAPGKWDSTVEARLSVWSGMVHVSGIMGDVAGTITLTPGPWQARCHVRGREEARRRSCVENESFFHGVEEWHVQLWPAP